MGRSRLTLTGSGANSHHASQRRLKVCCFKKYKCHSECFSACGHYHTVMDIKLPPPSTDCGCSDGKQCTCPDCKCDPCGCKESCKKWEGDGEFQHDGNLKILARLL